MIKVLFIAIGGAIGSVGRYALSSFAHSISFTVFPVGTLMVNLIGSFLIGILGGFFEGGSMLPQVRSFLVIGVLGGFTTFSSYSLETFNLMREGELRLAMINLVLNNVLGIVLAFLGFALVKQFQN